MTDANRWPEFFAQVPRIRLYDPLANLLGSVEGGLIEYGYEDAVALAGHSCPSVASAYWLTVCALRALYRAETPQRGGVRVLVRGAAYEGVAGVQASVISLLTGAAPITGFRGLSGQYRRANLLQFEANIPKAFSFTRLDTGESVFAEAHLAAVPAHPECQPLLQECLAGAADESECEQFRALWQERVRSLLLDYGDDHEVFRISPVLVEELTG